MKLHAESTVLHAESYCILHDKECLLYFTWPLIVTLLRVYGVILCLVVYWAYTGIIFDLLFSPLWSNTTRLTALNFHSMVLAGGESNFEKKCVIFYGE